VHCLWLTHTDPEPATHGQLIYSKGLIEATQRAGASLTVLGLSRNEHPRSLPDPRGIDWRLAAERPSSAWRQMLSPDPAAARRESPQLLTLLNNTLAERPWDVIVFDSNCAGWALAHVLRSRARSEHPSCLVYVAHNHEISVAQVITQTSRGLRRVVKRIDQLKVVALENRLVSAADVVTANTPEDCQRFAEDLGGRRIVLLPPGYEGPRLATRVIDSRVPRRVIVVGSFDWQPKRVALESFLLAAASQLSSAAIELQIVGRIEAGYLATMRRRFPSVDFVGPVHDVRPYLLGARLGLVPDLLGGFKLKGLDYVFHRLPILAMRAALPGMPLRDGDSVGLFDNHRALGDGVVRIVDDFLRLNGRHERAFAACVEAFDWDRIGRRLFEEMQMVRRK
jgi:glycosyltransferase involved in cell wall biosynthesis